MKRVVAKETLDLLPVEDPAAVRSRKDLRTFNGLMGNYRWFSNRLKTFLRTSRDAESDFTIDELGAGRGELILYLKDQLKLSHRMTFRAFDLCPAPDLWPSNFPWLSGDFLSTWNPENTDILMANLILHHFENSVLGQLAAKIHNSSIKAVFLNETRRTRFHHSAARLLSLPMSPVTREDAVISVKAGFRRGELSELLELNTRDWMVRETASPLGAIRLEAIRI